LGGLYNQGVITNEADPTAYANTNLFCQKLGGNQYNSWNVANGSELIDPVTRQVREGVTKNTLLRDGKIMLFKLQCVLRLI
jgi:hypothetical protein